MRHPLPLFLPPTCWMAGESLFQRVFTQPSIVTVPRLTSSRASMGTVPLGAVCNSSYTRTTALVMSVPSTTASVKRRLIAAHDQPSNRVASDAEGGSGERGRPVRTHLANRLYCSAQLRSSWWTQKGRGRLGRPPTPQAPQVRGAQWWSRDVERSRAFIDDC